MNFLTLNTQKALISALAAQGTKGYFTTAQLFNHARGESRQVLRRGLTACRECGYVEVQAHGVYKLNQRGKNAAQVLKNILQERLR